MSVDFYELPRSVQERFVAASRGDDEPQLILTEPPSRRPAVLWGAAGLAALAFVGAVASLGYGNLDSSLALSPVPFAAIYAIGFGGAGYCFRRVWEVVRAQKRRPYRVGTHVFPCGVIDARTPKLSKHAWTELQNLRIDGRTVVLDFAEGDSFSFTADSPERAQEAERLAQELREKLRRAQAESDRQTLVRLDPLLDTGIVSPLGPTESIPPPPASSQTLGLVAVVVTAALLGGGACWIRNQLSASRLYDAATELDTVEAYQAYMERGGNRADVHDTLLPSAELGVARGEGTVEAIERFVEAHPETKIRDEVDAALREALLADLTRAKKAGTLSALEELLDKRARYTELVPELQAARHKIFERELAHFTKTAPPKSKGLVEFFERLLGYAEKHGPRVEIRFVHRRSRRHELFDLAVKRSAYYMGSQSLPSQYFTAEGTTSFHQAAAERIAKRLNAAFSPGILGFVVGERIVADEGDELPEVKVPTVFVEARARLGGTFVSTKPRGTFVGAGVVFTTHFVIPNDDARFDHEASFWKRPPLPLLKEDGKGAADVYRTMLREASDSFVTDLGATLFRPG